MSGFDTGHLFKTTNGGLNWSDSSVTLPNAPANSVVVDPADGQIVYVGTDVGVFKSANGGASWSQLSAGMPNVAVMDLVLNRVGTRLFAFTHGRGAYVADRSGTGDPTLTPTAVAVSVTPTSAGTSTRTPTPLPTSTPSPTATIPVVIGGKGLAISSGSGGVLLTWQGGNGQTGYSILRLGGGTLSTLPVSGSLPASATSFTDPSAPPGFNCYVVVPQGTNPQAFSDLQCAYMGFHSAVGSPQNFTLRLNQSSTGSLTWVAPSSGGTDSYLLLTLGVGAQTVGGSVTNANLPTNGATCYAVGALSNNVLVGYTDLLCGVPGFATLSGSSSANPRSNLAPRGEGAATPASPSLRPTVSAR